MARLANAKYLAHVRSNPCLVCGQKAQAHHLKMAYAEGMGIKVDDSLTVPLCFTCHNDLHGSGDEATWWAIQGIDPMSWADRTYKDYSDEHR